MRSGNLKTMTHLVRCLACIAVLLGLSVGAWSPIDAATSSPVQLNSCTLIYANSNQITSQISGLSAQFTNESNQTATIVNISTDINEEASVIRDVGSFAPGIEIRHTYKTGGGQFALPMLLQQLFGKPSVKCAIASVQFADGSRWPASSNTSASVTSGNASAISVLPATLTLYGTGNASARLVLASGGGAIGSNSTCGGIATVDLLASTHYDLALRVTALAPGSCAITLRDANGNTATIPITINP